MHRVFGLWFALPLFFLVGISAAQERIGPARKDKRNPVVATFGGERLDLWSLRPLQKAPVGASIDSLLGTTQAPVADSRTLARRLSFGLTGLPPTEREVAAFTSAPVFAEQLLARHS
jgi:hypothetical protein